MDSIEIREWIRSVTRDDLPFSGTINFLPLSPSATDRSNGCVERRGKETAAHKHRVHTASVRRERKRAGEGDGLLHGSYAEQVLARDCNGARYCVLLRLPLPSTGVAL